MHILNLQQWNTELQSVVDMVLLFAERVVDWVFCSQAAARRLGSAEIEGASDKENFRKQGAAWKAPILGVCDFDDSRTHMAELDFWNSDQFDSRSPGFNVWTTETRRGFVRHNYACFEADNAWICGVRDTHPSPHQEAWPAHSLPMRNGTHLVKLVVGLLVHELAVVLQDLDPALAPKSCQK
jgi:hypothetical protein